MTAAAERKTMPVRITRPDSFLPILIAIGRGDIAIRAGTTVEINGRAHAFEAETPVVAGELIAGSDYAVGIGGDGSIFVDRVTSNPLIGDWVAGFHFAPGGNVEGKAGGDATPSINPSSLWDLDFRPACDPRGMALVARHGGHRFWADIYLLGTEHDELGTSRCGAVIADRNDRPKRPGGAGRYDKLDYPTAVEIYAHHGKRLMGAEEFFAAAYGVEERCSHEDDQKVTGSLADRGERFISRAGLFDVTGTMWQWGTDGHPDDPRPSLFGGSWLDGSDAGSRCADLDYWPGDSHEGLSARGACDHLKPD